MTDTLRYLPDDPSQVTSVDRMRIYTNPARSVLVQDLTPGVRQSDGSWLFTLLTEPADGVYYLTTTVTYTDGTTADDLNDQVTLPAVDAALQRLKDLTGGGFGRTDSDLSELLATHRYLDYPRLTGVPAVASTDPQLRAPVNRPDVYAAAAEMWEDRALELQAAELEAGTAGGTVRNGDVSVTKAAAGTVSGSAFATAARLRRKSKGSKGTSRVARDLGPTISGYGEQTYRDGAFLDQDGFPFNGAVINGPAIIL